jgi:hypothetical protein
VLSCSCLSLCRGVVGLSCLLAGRARSSRAPARRPGQASADGAARGLPGRTFSFSDWPPSGPTRPWAAWLPIPRCLGAPPSGGAASAGGSGGRGEAGQRKSSCRSTRARRAAASVGTRGGASLHSKTSRQRTGAYKGGGQEKERARAAAWGRETGDCARAPWHQQKRPGLMVRGEEGSEAEKRPVRGGETEGQSCD